MFRLAIEETESWFLADDKAVLRAYPKAKLTKLRALPADSIGGAWEQLAQALGMQVGDITGRDKVAWAEAIAPHLNLDQPNSPSFQKLIDGIARETAH